MAYLKKENGIWTLYYSCLQGDCHVHTAGGERHHVSLSTRNERTATGLLREFSEKQATHRAKLKLGMVHDQLDPNLRLSDAAKTYLANAQDEKSPATIARVERPALNHLVKFLGDPTLASVDVKAIDRYRKDFLTSHAGATWNSRRATLRAIWNWFITRKLVNENPWPKVSNVPDYEETHRLRPVPVTKVSEILSALPSRDWQLVALFLYSSMCRVEEMVNLLRTDVLRDEGRIRFRQPKERKADKQVRYKYLPLTPELDQIITEAEGRCQSEYVFSTDRRSGRPLLRRKVHKVLQRAGSRVGIVVSPHRLRKSGSTHSAAAGGDLRTLQTILGHSDIRTTQKYVRPDVAMQAEMMGTLNLAELVGTPNTLYRESVLASVQKALAVKKSRRRHKKDTDLAM